MTSQYWLLMSAQQKNSYEVTKCNNQVEKLNRKTKDIKIRKFLKKHRFMAKNETNSKQPYISKKDNGT